MKRNQSLMIRDFRQEFCTTPTMDRRQLSNKVKNMVGKRAKKRHLFYSVIVLMCLIAWFYQSVRILQDYLRFRSHKIVGEVFDLFTIAPAIIFCVNNIFDFNVVESHFPNWSRELSTIEEQLKESKSYMDTFERLTEFETLIKVYQIKTMNTISAVDIANSSISITDLIDTCLVMKANITQCKRVFGRPHTFYYATNKCITYNYQADKLQLFQGEAIVFLLKMNRINRENGIYQDK